MYVNVCTGILFVVVDVDVHENVFVHVQYWVFAFVFVREFVTCVC